MNKELMLPVKNRSEWRSWLEANHKISSEVWLVFFKKATGKPSITYDDAVEEAVCFGWVDGMKKSIDDERYAYRFTPRKPESKWSELNIKRAKKLLKAGLMTESGLRAFDGYESRKAPVLPTELPDNLKNIFQAEKKAWANFCRFSPSYQWVASAKQEKTQLRRLESVIAHASRNEKVKFM